MIQFHLQARETTHLVYPHFNLAYLTTDETPLPQNLTSFFIFLGSLGLLFAKLKHGSTSISC
jgi:hypothetical protein